MGKPPASDNRNGNSIIVIIVIIVMEKKMGWGQHPAGPWTGSRHGIWLSNPRRHFPRPVSEITQGLGFREVEGLGLGV